MKILITITLISIISINLLPQTTDDIPGPERVLVVYNANSAVSDSIRKHYVRVRGIPESNVKGINIVDPENYGCEWGVGGPEAGEEIIGQTSEDAGWVYVKEVIANVIENHLNTTYYEGSH